MKKYKNIPEQVQYLKNNKRIIVDDDNICVFYERNYSSLINPYKELFSNGRTSEGNHIYVSDISMEEILKIVKIDESFCEMLYTYIGSFEKKFKNILFIEICSYYIDETKNEEDICCISYIKEISKFLETESDEDLPRFCPNFRYQIEKARYVEDKYDLAKRKDLLLRIMEIGIGKSTSDNRKVKSNTLITHYLTKQKIAPLWILPNALTLGELHILFSMLDSEAQKRVMSKFIYVSDYNKISISKISSFSGMLDTIRNIRNIVNHYEPIFPFLVSNMRRKGNMKQSHIYKVFLLLENNYRLSYLNNVEQSELVIRANNYNSKLMKTLNFMKMTTISKLKSEPFDSLV